MREKGNGILKNSVLCHSLPGDTTCFVCIRACKADFLYLFEFWGTVTASVIALYAPWASTCNLQVL